MPRARRPSALSPLAAVAVVAAAAGVAHVAAARGGGDDAKRLALPEGAGLAAKYPRDAGIAKDPAVLLAEDFEEGEIADLPNRWDEVKNPGDRALAWSDDVVPGSHGKRSLRVTARVPEDTGGHLFKALARTADTAFARFHVKFPDTPPDRAGYVHHFVWLGGRNPQVRWPDPKAGTRPEGHAAFNVAIEPWGLGGRVPPPGAWNFYVYWHEMKVSADGRHWGNGIHPVEEQRVPRDRWQCVEFMVKLNSVTARKGAPDGAADDGELALWLDGKLVAHVAKGVRRGPWSGMGFHLLRDGGEPFEGLRWRTSKDLRVSNFWLEHYVTAEALRRCGVKEPYAPNSVLFDDVVVATEYVGPVAAKAAAPGRR